MKSKLQQTLWLIVIPLTIILVGLACSLPSTPTSVPASITPSEATKGIPSDTPEPTDTPQTATVTPTDTPLPIEPDSFFPVFLPVGFVADPGNLENSILNAHKLNGELISQVPAPGMSAVGSPNSVHAAGGYSDGIIPPIVYVSTGNDGSLQYSENGEIITVAIAPHISYLVGAHGQASMVYTTARFEENALISELFIGNLETLNEVEPLMVRTDSAGWTFRPIAIDMLSEQPIGIWYSLTPWGIGGDIVFEPRQGLFYFDLTTKEIAETLDPSINPISFSPDLTWLAFTQDQIEQPLTIIPDLETERAITFPLAPESDRGAGKAVFSPGNEYVAWMEASGLRLAAVPDFNILIRVAATDGQMITEFAAVSVAEAVGSQNIQWVEPVGWLDNETLLLQVHFDTWAQTEIVSVKYDGSEMSPLAAGNFANFIYP
jgi:hypothetical protein